MIKYLNMRINKLFFVFIICILGGAIYANTFHSSFHFDDTRVIVENPQIRDVFNIAIAWTNTTKHLMDHTLGVSARRLIPYLSFAVNYHFHKLDVFGYHVVNVGIHVINALLVWWLVGMGVRSINRKHTSGVCLRRKIKNTPPRCVYGSTVALCATFIFLCHPVQTQAVTYIAQRFTLLGTMFYLLSVCLYMKGRCAETRLIASVRFVGAAIAAVLGMFSKEIVFTLPFMILVLEFYFFRREGSKRIIDVPWYYIVLILSFAVIIPCLYSFNLSGVLAQESMSEASGVATMTRSVYFLTQFKVLVTYLKLFLFPVGQNLDYDFPLAYSIFEWPTLLSMLTCIVLFGFAIWMRTRNKLVTLGIIWFFLTLSVESSFIPIADVIFEHRMYLPSVGLCLALTAGMYSLIRNSRMFVSVVSGVIIIFSCLTFQRNKVWNNEITLWEDVVQKSPHKSRPHNNLGKVYYLQRRDTGLALTHLNQALMLNPNNVSAYNNRGSVYQMERRYDLALADFTQALLIDSESAIAHNNRGVIYQIQKKYDLALVDFDAAIVLNPANASRYVNRANVYFSLGQYEKALKDYGAAIKIDPRNAQAYSNRGGIFAAQQLQDLALWDYNKAIAINLNFKEAYFNRGNIYAHQKQYALALEDYNRALAIDPGYAKAQQQRAWVRKAMEVLPND